MQEVRILPISRLLSETEWNTFSLYLTKEKRERLAQYLRPEDAQRSMLGEMLVKLSVRERERCPLHEIIIDKHSSGKPYLSYPSNLFFNISHSDNWIAIAIDLEEIGVDVEDISPIDLGIAKRFFTEKENIQLFSVSEIKRLELFYTFWTLKESFLKLIGEGLRIPLNSFSFDVRDMDAIKIEMLKTVPFNKLNSYSFQFHVEVLDNQSVLSVASSSGNPIKIHVYKSIDDFLDQWQVLV